MEGERNLSPSMDRPSSAITILIVEDNPADRRLFEAIFSEYWIFNEIHWAESGEEAIVLIRTNKPRLVFLDRLLPGKSGFDVVNEIKSDEALKSVSVVMMSSSFDLDYCKKKAPKADAFVTKPITFESIASIVSKIDHFAVGVIALAED